MAITFLNKHTEINKVVLIPLSQVFKSPSQPRTHFDDDAILELAQSIAENGLLQPITVRKIASDYYELIAGERRTRAFRLLEKAEIPAIIDNCTTEQSIILTLIENLQRKDLNYFEEAIGISKLMQELDLSQQQISQRLGKAQSTIANKLRLLKFSPALQVKMLEANFTERHARALLKISDNTQLDRVIDIVIKDNLNVEQTEHLISKITNQSAPHKQGTRIFVVKDMRVFMNSIQKAINTMNDAGIPVNSVKSEDENYIEMVIKIPKTSVYKETKPSYEFNSLALAKST